MPTISAHVSEDEASAVESAAKASTEKRVGPYIAEAVRQRMAREGMLPGDANAELLAAAHKIGTRRALDLLTAAQRTKRAA